MSTKDNGGPAFPSDYYSPEVYRDLYPTEGAHRASKLASGQSAGMTLRDWFAGQAMASVIGANPEFSAKAVSEWAYIHADAMLAERAK